MLAYSKILAMFLDKLGMLMDVEERMADPETVGESDLTTEAGISHFLKDLQRVPVSILSRLSPKKLQAALHMANDRKRAGGE